MKSFLHLFAPSKEKFYHATLYKFVCFSFTFLVFRGVQAQNGSECYKPFTGTGKVPYAIQNGVKCIACATSGNISNLVDGDINNYVELNQLVGIATGNGVMVKDSLVNTQGGFYAGYVFGLDPSILNIDIVKNITVSTYKDDVLQESRSGNTLTAVPLMDGSLQKTYLYFATTLSFNEIRFTFNSLVTTINTLNIFYAMAFDPNCGVLENNNICDDGLQSAGTVVNFNSDLVCAGCSITNPENIVDANKDNYATLFLPATVLASSSVGVLDEQNIYPAGYKAGFIISPDNINAFIDANILNNIVIETYLLGKLQESQVFNSGSGLLKVTALSSSSIRKTKVGFTTTKKFNEVRLVVNQPSGVSLGVIRIYGAYEEPSTCTDCENSLISTASSPYTGSLVTGNYSCGTFCSMPWTGVYGVGVHSLSNQANIVNGSFADYATYSSVVGLLNTGVNITVQNNGPTFPAGTFGGFVIAKEGGLLDLNLLPAITISLYNGTNLIESKSGTALLGAGVLTLSDGKTALGFKSTAAFNRIKINIDNGLISAGLGGNYRIYNAFVIIDTDNDGTPDCIDTCPGANNVDTDGDGIPDACDACNTGTIAPVLGSTSFTSVCPAVTIDLSTVTANNKPSTTTLTFHTGTPATTSNKLLSLNSVAEGLYYAAFFDALNNCYGATREVIVTSSCSLSSLPVKISSFTASLNWDYTVKVKWITSTEINVSHFIVERSYDGKIFNEATVVFAHGNTTSKMNYEFNDNLGLVQNNILYYRLRSVDIDGKSELSEIRIIRLQHKNDQDIKILVYPNPVVSKLEIKIPNVWYGKKISFELITNNGQVSKRFIIGSSRNIEYLNMLDVAPGLYLLKATCNSQSTHQKILKK